MNFSRRPRRTRTRNSQQVVIRNSSKPVDTWLGRAASISQPLVLLLALFGYFYTVIPVYQKEVLSEQIAAKEIELARLQQKIDLTGPETARLQSEATSLQKKIVELNTQSELGTALNNSLRQRQATLESTNTQLSIQVEKKSQDASTAEKAGIAADLRAYHDSFSASVSMQYMIRNVNGYDLVEAPGYEAIDSYLITPYGAITSTLAAGDSRFMPSVASIPRAIKDAYHKRLRQLVEARKDALSRPQTDVNALLFQITSEIGSTTVDATPLDNFNEKRYATVKKLVDVLRVARERESDRTNEFMSTLDLREIAPANVVDHDSTR